MRVFFPAQVFDVDGDVAHRGFRLANGTAKAAVAEALLPQSVAKVVFGGDGGGGSAGAGAGGAGAGGAAAAEDDDDEGEEDEKRGKEGGGLGVGDSQCVTTGPES